MDQQPPTIESPGGPGRAFAWLAVIAGILVLTGIFQFAGRPGGGIVESVSDGTRVAVVLERGRGGHFTAEGEVNGLPVNFLVDTGATDVALSERSARAMGLEFGPRITVMTAAGPSPAWRTRLDSVQLGSLRLENVRATITPGLGETALLGMSFLQYFDWRQESDRLVIERSQNG